MSDTKPEQYANTEAVAGADMRARLVAPEPSLIDLVQELRRTVGLFDGAMSITPKQAWEEALEVVRNLRRGYCPRCYEKECGSGPHTLSLAERPSPVTPSKSSRCRPMPDRPTAAPGVPALPWRLRLHCDDVKHYEGHAFLTADPKGLARSVCDGFVDDMAWIAQMHNALIIKSWRVRLARRLLGLTSPHITPPESVSEVQRYDGSQRGDG